MASNFSSLADWSLPSVISHSSRCKGSEAVLLDPKPARECLSLTWVLGSLKWWLLSPEIRLGSDAGFTEICLVAFLISTVDRMLAGKSASAYRELKWSPARGFGEVMRKAAHVWIIKVCVWLFLTPLPIPFRLHLSLERISSDIDEVWDWIEVGQDHWIWAGIANRSYCAVCFCLFVFNEWKVKAFVLDLVLISENMVNGFGYYLAVKITGKKKTCFTPLKTSICCFGKKRGDNSRDCFGERGARRILRFPF